MLIPPLGLKILVAAAVGLSLLLISPTKVSEPEFFQEGIASWYDYKIHNDIGIYCNRYKEDCFTESNFIAASRDFPRSTVLLVTNKKNGKQVKVTVTDWVENEKVVIDLSSRAFQELAPLETGLINVTIKPINKNE